MKAPVIAGKKLVFAPILRAGLALVEGMLDLVPAARVAHIGLYRDAGHQGCGRVFLEDAGRSRRTRRDRGGAGGRDRQHHGRRDRSRSRSAAPSIRAACLLASPEGVERLRGIHPDVRLWTGAIDERLDEDAYIIPGLGDAGNRAYGTE